MILFLILILASFFGAHFLLYFSLIKLFAIQSPLARIIIGTALGVLAASFVVSSFVTHFIDTPLSRAIYIASGTWVGLLINFLLAMLLGWIFFHASDFFGLSLPIGRLFALLLFMSACYAAYGIYNAFHPRVKDISVTINNLPENWKGKTIVQLSDVHLGHIYRKAFLEKVVKEVNGLKPDLVVITGDLFDGMDGNLEHLTLPLSDLKPRYGTFFITGNHETYLGVKRTFETLGETPNIRILNDETENVGGLQIIGLSYPEREGKKDIPKAFASMENFQKGLPTVLLYHAPSDISQFKDFGVNLQLSGHTHKGQLFPFGFIAEMIYGKYYYGLNTEGDYSIYTTNGTGTWGPPMRTGNTPEIVRIKLN